MKKIARYFVWTFTLLAVIAAFAGIDAIIHSIRPEWDVPEYYFRNKIIFGFLLGIPTLFVARRFRQVWQQAIVFTGSISVLLQARYLIEGYPIDFVVVFLFILFAILFLLSMIALSVAKKLRRY